MPALRIKRYDGDIYYTIVLNGFIHFIMYAYYFMSIFNIPLAKFIRPLVTNAQLIQFVTMMSQAVRRHGPTCYLVHFERTDGGTKHSISFLSRGCAQHFFACADNCVHF